MYSGGAFELQPDLSRQRMRGQDEVVLQLVLGAVVTDVNAWPDFLQPDSGERRHASDPPPRIAPDELIGGTRQCFLSDGGCIPPGANQLHSENGATRAPV